MIDDPILIEQLILFVTVCVVAPTAMFFAIAAGHELEQWRNRKKRP